ncbi:MAG: HAMP domain-containing histidine kinase [Bacteroidales bacterium]|nr:HAMP domain-containing histidine kinase [Bacteroidales bacterium]
MLGCVIYYEDNEGNFAVSVTASNIYAEKINKTFLIVLLCILVFTSLILYLASRLYAIRILENKENIYQKQKLFIDGASHEINNPLAAISGQCEVTLLKDRTVEQYKQTVSNVYNQTQRITDIIKNLLLFSKTENLKTDTQNMQTFLLSDFLKQFKSQNVSISIEKDAQVCTNKELLSLAVGNIVSNAGKFSSDGKAYVTLNGNILRVKNNGKGIAKEDLPHIFEPFYRGKTALAIHGHGIGLALSKSIFDDMKADVRVNSEPEKGAEFVIKLP